MLSHYIFGICGQVHLRAAVNGLHFLQNQLDCLCAIALSLVLSVDHISAQFVEVCKSVSDAVNKGNFGYYDNVFFPAATQTRIVNIDEVWYGTSDVDSYVQSIQDEFAVEFENGLVPPIPAPSLD